MNGGPFDRLRVCPVPDTRVNEFLLDTLLATAQLRHAGYEAAQSFAVAVQKRLVR